MADESEAEAIADLQKLHRFPQSEFVDGVRFLPLSPSPFSRLLAAAFHRPSSSSSSLQILTLSRNPDSSPSLTPLSSTPVSSRVASLCSSPSVPLLAATTFSGSLHLVPLDPVSGALTDSAVGISGDVGFHSGPIRGLDIFGETCECVTAGEDGRVNVVKVLEDARLTYQRVCGGYGLAGYTAVKWASPSEFVIGGIGVGVQWWDQRRPGGPVAQFKGVWGKGIVNGMVHSVDIFPSRKHICVAGGSSGTVFAWDLRAQHQGILLSGFGLGERIQPVCESEVWEVHYDIFAQTSRINPSSSAQVLPVMICSEDGFLAVLEQGADPVELISDYCAINTFDIDPQNPSDVICGMEWESIGILLRERETFSQ